jgi:hypothetical protein
MIARSWTQLLPWMVVYAIAMAMLESAVVIYLRELYYPVEFRFPVVPIAPHIAITELLREFATMIMLLAPGALLITRRLERFAWFCICFGVWDIFYYVFLKAILDWPATIIDWDILFLIPVVWVGPVLAPCMVSLGLIGLGCALLYRRHHDPSFAPERWQWVSLIASGVVVLYTFVEEPFRYILRDHGLADTTAVPTAGHMALDRLREYVPVHYSWGLFLFACAMATTTIMLLARRRGPKKVATR